MDTIRTLALLLLRCALGVIFFYHGATKVAHLGQWTTNFVHMGFPGYFAYIAGSLEAVGGVALIVGFLTRLFGILLAGEMLIALLRVHLPSGPITNVPGYGLPMLLSGAAFLIFAYGAGAWSVDRAVWKKKPAGR